MIGERPVEDDCWQRLGDQVAVKLLREQLEWLRARYDGEKYPPSVFAVMRTLEVDISWAEHQQT
jgi:hypothetical protein